MGFRRRSAPERKEGLPVDSCLPMYSPFPLRHLCGASSSWSARVAVWHLAASLFLLLTLGARLQAQEALWGMGWDGRGQLGRGGALFASQWQRAGEGVAQFAAGEAHALWLKKDGTLWAAGSNAYGQLGDGTHTDRAVPVQVASGVSAVAAGRRHSLFLKADGSVWGMGDNANGQLGSGSLSASLRPLWIASDAKAVSACGDGSYYIGTDLVVRGMGDWMKNAFSQKYPEPLAADAREIAAGNGFLLVLKNDGTVWGLGSNYYGQFGEVPQTTFSTPVAVASGVASIGSGRNHALLVKTDGSLWASGYNARGQLGDGTLQERRGFVQVVASGVRTAKGGANHTLFVKTDGTAWGMGAGLLGQLGDGGGTDRLTPVQIATGVQAVAAGVDFSLALKTDDSLWATGVDNSGQLGLATSRNAPSPVRLGADVKGLAAGEAHTLTIASDGSLWASGANDKGQLGDGTTIDRSTPVRIAEGVVAVAAGGKHSLFIKTDGTLWGMGAASSNQLGVSVTGIQSVPARIDENVRQVAAGASFSAYIKEDNSLWVMDSVSYYGYGGGALTSTSCVCVAEEVRSVSAGSEHVLFVKTDGTLFGFGTNQRGALGYSSSAYPTQLATAVQSAAAGGGFSLFVGTDGVLRLLGTNEDGTIGYEQGATYDTLRKPRILATGVIAVVAGLNHALYTDEQGTLWALGGNASGQLGEGVFLARERPVPVATKATLMAAGGSHSLFVAGEDIAVARQTPRIDGFSPQGYSGPGQVLVTGAHFVGATSVRFDGVEAASFRVESDARIVAQLPVNLASGGPIAVTTAGGTATSAASFAVPVAIVASPQEKSVVLGNAFTLSVTAAGAAPLSYQWRLNGIPLAGATQASFTVAQAKKSDEGSYDVLVSNVQGSVASLGAFVKVVLPPAVETSGTERRFVPAGGIVVIGVTVAAEPGLSYRWKRNGAVLPGVVGRRIELWNVSAADAGTYSVEVSNGAGTVQSIPMEVIVEAGTAPVIRDQPVSKTVFAGQYVNFSVGLPSGYSYQYQWRKNGVPIAGATNLNFYIQAAVLADADDYSVMVTNANGSTTSATARLTVEAIQAPIIERQPADVTVACGESVSLSVGVRSLSSGGGSVGVDPQVVPAVAGPVVAVPVSEDPAGLRYQWSRGGTPITGATQASLWINYAAPGDAGSYTVTVSNGIGAVTSQPAVVVVGAPLAPAIVVQPVGRSVAYGQSFALSVTARGSAPLRYQWKRNGVAIVGAKQSSLELDGSRFDAAGAYSVEVSNVGGSVESSIASVVVGSGVPPVILRSPVSAAVDQGSSVVLEVQVNEAAGLQFIWRKNGVPLVTGESVYGLNSNRLTLSSVQAVDVGSYSVEVRNAYGAATSDTAMLSINTTTAPAIVAQPVGRIVNYGESSSSFSVTVTGSQPMAFQWMKDGIALGGATQSTFHITKVYPSYAGSYSVRVSNAVGSVTSNTAQLTVLPAMPPVITSLSKERVAYVGSALRLFVSATGAQPLVYEWEKDGVSITGNSSSLLFVDTRSTAGSGTYRVRVRNDVGSVLSDAMVVTVVPATAPVIVVQPLPTIVRMVDQNSEPQLRVEARGSEPLSYQWKKDGLVVSGATNSIFQLYSPKLSDAGIYTVDVSNSAGRVTSEASVVTVSPGMAPTVVFSPTSSVVAYGTAVSLSPVITGSPTLTFEWRKDGVVLPGVTSGSLWLGNAKTTDGGVYTVVVSNGAGSATSNAYTLQVDSGRAPSIQEQPFDVTANHGASASFNVIALGSPPLVYRWVKNGVPLAGATTASFQLGGVVASDAGSYSVQVSNAFGSVQSNAAVLSVGAAMPPVIVSHPVNQDVPNGVQVKMGVQATGSGPLVYQWKRDGVPLLGKTESQFWIEMARAGDAGLYSVEVNNPFGKVVSQSALLTVAAPKAPVITLQPQSLAVTAGSSGSLSVGVSGSLPMRYAWKRNGAVLNGETGSSLYFWNSATAAGTYTVSVTNDAGSVESASAIVTVTPSAAPEILTQPSSLSVISGENATLSVSARGEGVLRYQWLRNGFGVANSDRASLSFISVAPWQAGEYAVLVSNEAGQVKSAVAVLTVAPAVLPSIQQQPSSISVAEGTSASFNVSFSGSASVQWFKDGQAIPGANYTNYSISSVRQPDVGVYTVRLSNAAGFVTSEGASLTLRPAALPTLTVQKTEVTAIEGSSSSLSVSVVGEGDFQYVWKKDGLVIPSATSGYLSFAEVKKSDAGIYRLTVSNAAGSVESQPITLTVTSGEPPRIIDSPLSVEAPHGAAVSLRVIAVGSDPLRYKWIKNGVEIPGQTGGVLWLYNVSSSDAGSFWAVVSNAAGSVTSAAASLTVSQPVPPRIVVQPMSKTVLLGGRIDLAVSAEGSSPFTYVWRRNGVVLESASSATYSIYRAEAAHFGTYTVEIKNAAGSVMSAAAVVQMATAEAPVICVGPVSTRVYEGTSAGFSIVVSGSDPLRYQWRKGSWLIPNATNQSLYFTPAQRTDAGDYSVVVSNAAGTVASESARFEVVVPQPPVILRQPQEQAVYLNCAFSMAVEAVGEGVLKYQWYLNGSAVNGATGATLSFYQATKENEGSYTVRIANAGGVVTSAAASLSVRPPKPPIIIEQPAGKAVRYHDLLQLSVWAIGMGPIQCQWFKDGVPVNQSSSLCSLSVSSAKPSDAGTYQAKLWNDGGSVFSASAVVTVGSPEAPSIRSQPQSATIENGSSTNLGIFAEGSSPLSYQWFKDGVALANATSSSLEVSQAGRYTVRASNSAGTATSQEAVISVKAAELPKITSQPRGSTVRFGESITSSVSVSSATPVTYQWKKDGVPVEGGTGGSLYIYNARPSDSGGYSVEVRNAAGIVVSETATFLVEAAKAPVITQQPQDVAVQVNANTGFQISVEGTVPLYWQWYLNDQAIPGATGSYYSINHVTTTHVGGYSVRISSPYGSVVSRVAKLEIAANPAVPPTITRQPLEAMVHEGASVSLSVAASGSAPLQYQWRRDGVLLEGSVSGLTLSAVQASMAGSYTVTVSNAAGSVVSQSAVVTVLPMRAPTISSQPSSKLVPYGESVQLSVSVSGGGSMDYQWYKDGVCLTGSGFNSPTLSISQARASDAGSYSVVVRNEKGVIESETALITVSPAVAPTIVDAPKSQSTKEGESVALSVSGTGSLPIQFLWRKNGSPAAAPASAVYDGRSCSLSLSPVGMGDAGQYTVTLSNAAGSVTSAPVTVLVSKIETIPPAITRQPVSTTVDYGSTAFLSVEASGTLSLQYQWYKDGEPMMGANSSYLGLYESRQSATYTVKVTNAYGSAVSGLAVVTVRPGVAPAISSHPSSTAVTTGGYSSFYVSATGSSPLTYRWFKDGVEMSGKVSSYLSIDAAKASDAGAYTVEVSNTFGKAVSNAGILTIQAPVPPAITGLSPSASVAQGAYFGLNVTAQGSGVLCYQWYRNGQALTGATSQWYSRSEMMPEDAGTYTVTVTSPYGSVTSAPIVLTLLPGQAPVVQTQPNSVTDDYGASLYLYVYASGTGPLSYQWRKDGVVLSGATSSSLSRSNATPADSGSYSVVISNAFGSATSANASVVVRPPAAPTIQTQPLGGTVAPNGRVEMTVTAKGTGTLNYQWMKNGVLLGVNGSRLPIYQFQEADVGVYTVRVYNDYGVVTSQPAAWTLQTGASPTIVTQPQPRSVAYGGSATFTVQASGAATLRYQWKRNGLSVAGATSATMTLPSAKTSDAGNYSVVVWNESGSTTSQAVTLAVSGALPLRITRQPEAQLVVQGQPVSLVVAAEGAGTLTYQWRKDGVAIAGATASTYAIANAQSQHAGSYSVSVADEVSSIVSSSVRISVVPTGVNAVHALVGEGYRAGNTVTITTTLSHPGGATDVVVDVLLPSGWSYVSGTGEGAVKPSAGAVDTLHWSWTVAPASPFTFTYTLQVPAGQSGDKTIVSMATMTLPGQPAFGFLVKPDPLIVRDTAYHSADTNRDWRIGTEELLRVIDLFNARQGASRTGCYRVLETSVDGFDPDTTRTFADTVALARLHDADTDRNGRLDLAELTRLIQLYNARQGTTRTGEYHPRADGEPASVDGYTPGPRL